MSTAKWKTINQDKLQLEVDKLSVEIDSITPVAARTKDIGLAVRISSLTATHNALIGVINSLD